MRFGQTRQRSFAPSAPVLATMALIGILVGCGSDSTGPENQSGSLTVTPNAAPPGAVVIISGPDANNVSGDVGLEIGGQPAAIHPEPSGDWAASVPVFFDADANVVPPDGPLDVVLTADGVPISESTGAIEIEPLPAAPGTAQQLLTRLEDAVDALSALADSASEGPSTEEQYRYAIAEAVRALVQSDDSLSLRSLIADLSTTSDEFALFESLLGTSQLPAAADRLASHLEHLATTSSSAWRLGEPAGGPPAADGSRAGPGTSAATLDVAASVPTIVSDLELAYKMQEYVVRKEFGEVVVSNTSSTWSNWFNTSYSGLTLISKTVKKRFKLIQSIAAVLSVLDFYINKLTLGFYPASVDTMELTVTNAQLSQGESAGSKVTVVAVNDPPVISVNDITGQVLNALGTLNPSGPLWQEFTSYVLGVMQSQLSAYDEVVFPDTDLDYDLIEIPDMAWQATIEDPRLVEQLSTDSEIIEGHPDIVEWHASTTNTGGAEIWARSTIGPVFINPGPGVDYGAGVFGNDVAVETNRVSVQVIEALSFAGSYVGTYDASGGCNDDSQSGNIEFQIGQDGSTLTATYSLDPDFDGLTVYGGQAEIVAETPNSFVGTITEPSQLDGTFTGSLSEDGTVISGTVDGTAQTLCNGIPAEVAFNGSYEGTRQ